MTTSVLIVYYSRHGSVQRMSEDIAVGINSVTNAEAICRRVPEVSTVTENFEPAVAPSGDAYASLGDLENCDALILGSPGYFGNMASPLKYFLDQATPVWLSGALIGKPAGVFTATSSQHGGQETVLNSMMLPLLHQGMLITGIPYSEASLNRTTTGGTPYGASHVAGPNGSPLSDDEIAACRALGARIAAVAGLLKGNRI